MDEIPFTLAKARLSELMDRVEREHARLAVTRLKPRYRQEAQHMPAVATTRFRGWPREALDFLPRAGGQQRPRLVQGESARYDEHLVAPALVLAEELSDSLGYLRRRLEAVEHGPTSRTDALPMARRLRPSPVSSSRRFALLGGLQAA